mmetsp:Transcript_19350/g.30702  ORF Transcript_19350/g.30702 Transcript_19350/m.30702 type:complete len:215 (-) Transcript_19350:192-836(-)
MSVSARRMSRSFGPFRMHIGVEIVVLCVFIDSGAVIAKSDGIRFHVFLGFIRQQTPICTFRMRSVFRIPFVVQDAEQFIAEILEYLVSMKGAESKSDGIRQIETAANDRLVDAVIVNEIRFAAVRFVQIKTDKLRDQRLVSQIVQFRIIGLCRIFLVHIANASQPLLLFRGMHFLQFRLQIAFTELHRDFLNMLLWRQCVQLRRAFAAKRTVLG